MGDENTLSRNRQLNLNDDEVVETGPPQFEGNFIERTIARCRYEVKHADWKQILIGNGFLLMLLFLMTASMVMVKKMSARLKNYPFTLGQAQPVITSTLFGCIYLVTLIISALHRRFFPSPPIESDRISEEEKSRLLDYAQDQEGAGKARVEEVHDWKWWTKLYFHLAVVGTFLSIGNILLFSGSRGDYVPGPISILLQQMTIPSTLIISIFLFRTRFFIWHYLGAVVVIAGVLITLSPEFDQLQNQGTKVWAVLSIIGAAVCNAMGMAYMENFVVQTKDINLAWMWMVINIFEIFTTIPLMLAVAPLTNLSFDETFPNIRDGYACLFAGKNTITDDDCEGAIYLYVPLICVFVASRMNIAYVVQRMNAALMWFVATCALPLANIAFTLHFIMGDRAISLNAEMIIGLIVVMGGLLIFRLSRKPEPKGYAHLPSYIFNILCCCRLPPPHTHNEESCCHESTREETA